MDHRDDLLKFQIQPQISKSLGATNVWDERLLIAVASAKEVPLLAAISAEFHEASTK